VDRILELLGCTVDLDERLAHWPDGDRTLTPTEAKLLGYLAGAEGRAVERADLLEQVWGYRPGVISRTVKTTVARLRAKTELEPPAPDHLITVVGSGYRFAPASPEALAAARTARPPPPDQGEEQPPRAHLPSAREHLTGRDAVLASTAATLEHTRLVSLVGPGGVGKTALLLELAHGIVARDAWDELAFVDLRRASTAADVLAEVAAALDVVPERADVDEAIDALAGALRSRGRLLLLLDDCERAAAELAHVIPAWLRDCPRLAVVLTSREVLRIAGESVVPVEPLSEDDAVALFRARMPDQPAGGYGDAAVRALVEHLDRIPLALEMAAAWTDLLDAESLAQRLGSQLDVLRSPRRDRPTKHGSLRATVASSWALLDPQDRRGLSQLATFAGAFSIDDADEVTGGGTLAVLRRLRDRSLLHSAPVAGEPGMRLFRAVRDYAREQGRDTEAEARHGARVARWGEPSRLARLVRRGGPELDALMHARPDLLLGAERAQSRGDEETLQRCAFALAALADLRGPALVEPELFVPLTDAEPELALRARIAMAALRMGRGQTRAAERELAAAEALVDKVGPEDGARSLLQAARILGSHAPAEARAVAERGRALAAAAGDEDLAAIATARVAAHAHALGESAAAQAGFEAALPGLQTAGALREEGRTLAALAQIHAERGRPRRATSLHEQALAIVREVGDRTGEAVELDALATLLAEQGDADGARAAWQDAIGVARSAGDRQLEARIAAHRAVAARRDGAGERARVGLLEALELAREVEDTRTQVLLLAQLGELDLSLGHVSAARASLLRAVTGAERLEAPDLEGAARGALGELLCATGEFEAGRGQLARGRVLLADARRRLALLDLLERHAEVEAAAGNRAAAEELLHAAADEAQLSQLDGSI